MNTVKVKIQAQSGVIIVFSLVVFLIASIFCVTIISAALTTASNVYEQSLDEREVLAVTATANCLLDIVKEPDSPDKGKLIRTVKETETITISYEPTGSVVNRTIETEPPEYSLLDRLKDDPIMNAVLDLIKEGEPIFLTVQYKSGISVYIDLQRNNSDDDNDLNFSAIIYTSRNRKDKNGNPINANQIKILFRAIVKSEVEVLLNQTPSDEVSETSPESVPITDPQTMQTTNYYSWQVLKLDKTN